MLFLAAFVFCAGCSTAKGIVQGAATGLKEDAKGVANGAGCVFQGIKKTDDWIKENLW